MSIKAIIFNKDKFVNSKYQVPTKFIAHAGAFMTGHTAAEGYINCRPTKDLTFDCLGIYDDQKGYFDNDPSERKLWYIFDRILKPDENNTHHTIGYGPAYVAVKDCTPIFENGGGNSPL